MDGMKEQAEKEMRRRVKEKKRKRDKTVTVNLRESVSRNFTGQRNFHTAGQHNTVHSH